MRKIVVFLLPALIAAGFLCPACQKAPASVEAGGTDAGEQQSTGELRTLLKLANPFAPHVTEEIWSVMNFGGQISGQSWPTYDPAKCVDSMVEIAVQLAGKIKARIMVPADITAADAIAAAKAEVLARNGCKYTCPLPASVKPPLDPY